MSPSRRRLVLLRHAAAVHHGGVSDELRPLSPTGRRQAAEVGGSLARAGLVPDAVYCSIALRTRETYELVAQAFGAAPEVVYSEDLYGAGISGTLSVVADAPGRARTLLVVGHEPVMSGVAAVLAGSDSDPAAAARVQWGVPVGAYSVLEVSGAWSRLGPGSAVLTAVVTPAHVL